MLRKVSTWLDSLEYMIIVLCGVGIVGLIFLGVISRFVFHFSIAWSEELARYMFLWGALFGASAACRNAQHGGIPMLVDKFPFGAQKLFELIVPVGTAAFLTCMGWQSAMSASRSYTSGQVSSTTEIPVWVVNAIMAGAFFLASVRCIQGYFERAYRLDQINLTD